MLPSISLFLALFLAGHFYLQPRIRDLNTTSRVLSYIALFLVLWSFLGQSILMDIFGRDFLIRSHSARFFSRRAPDEEPRFP